MGHNQATLAPLALRQASVADSEAKGQYFVIGCDAIAHRQQWGSTDKNEMGESLFNYLLSTRLLICNRGNIPTFIIKNRQEVLDLTLVSHSIQG